MTLLLVEDQGLISFSEKKILEQYGYEVITAFSGAEAVKTVQNNKNIDLILMDIDLGEGIDGTVAAEQILEKTEIPIIFMSSHTEKEIVQKTDCITSYGYIIKTTQPIIWDTSIKMALKLFHSNMKCQQTDSLYRDLVETSQDLIWQCDTQGCFQYLNPTWEKVFGYKLEEMLGKKLTDFQSPEQAELDRKAFSVLKKSEILTGYETLCKGKSGQDIYLVFNVKNIIDKNGDVIGTRGTACDITDGKNAQDIQQQADHRFRALVDLAADGILVGSHAGLIIDANECMCTILGMKKNDILGKHISQLPFTPECLIQKPFQFDLLQKGENVITERSLIRSDGSEVLVEMHSKMMPDGTYHSIFRDITGHKRLQNSLSENLARFRSTFDQSPVGSMVVGLNRRFISINSAFCKFIGYTEKELIDKTISDITYPDDFEIGMKEMKLLIEGKAESTTVQKRYLCKDGTIKWGEISISLVRNHNNQPIYFLPIVIDISLRKKSEEEINRLLNEKNILLKEVHHRIKNNIAAIEGLLRLQSLSVNNQEALKVLDNAMGQVKTIRLLYDNLLISENYKETSCNDYFCNLVDTIIALFPSTVNIKIEKKIGAFTLNTKLLFPLGLIINELLTNAMKYAFTGKPTGLLQIEICRSNDKIKLSIADNGIGFPLESDSHEKKGFGCLLVEMLIKQIGGSMTVQKENGTRYSIECDIH